MDKCLLKIQFKNCAELCYCVYNNNLSQGLSMDGDWTSQLVKLISLLELNKTLGGSVLSGQQ